MGLERNYQTFLLQVKQLSEELTDEMIPTVLNCRKHLYLANRRGMTESQI